MPNFGDAIKLSTSTRIQVGDYFNRVQKGNWYWGGTSTGSATAHAITVEGGATSFVDGQIVAFIPGFTGTGSATLAVNGTTPRAIRRPNFSSLLAGDLVATNSIAVCMWASSNNSWILLSDPAKILQTWTPTLGASGSMTFTSTTIVEANYQVFGQKAIGTLNVQGTTGGTASTDLTATIPPVLALINTDDGNPAIIRNAGTRLIGKWITSSVFVIRKSDDTNWALGANTEYSFNFQLSVQW